MKRVWNAFVWAGFAVVVLSVLSYFFFFLRFPATRDFPWVNLLLFAAGGGLLGIGLKRAFGQPARYRGKVSGIVLSVLSLSIVGLFCYGMLSLTKDLPSAAGAPQAGMQAPNFTLPDIHGSPVMLSELLKKNRAVLLIFYRGYW